MIEIILFLLNGLLVLCYLVVIWGVLMGLRLCTDGLYDVVMRELAEWDLVPCPVCGKQIKPHRNPRPYCGVHLVWGK